MKFTKENFQKKYKPGKPKELEEVVIGGGGDTVITNNEISTDTQVSTGVDKSDRKKGMSKTMDKHISQVRNHSATFGLGGEMGVPFGGRPGNQYVDGGEITSLDVNDTTINQEDEENTEEITESSKDKMRRMVKELMDSRNDTSELVSKSNDVLLNNKTTELIKILKTKAQEEVQAVIEFISNEVGNNNNKPNL